MWKPIPYLVLTLLACAPGLARAEITTQSGPGGETVTEGRIGAECWQQGRQIMSEADLEAANIGGYLRERSLSLKRAGRAGAGVIVVPFGETVCILRTAR
jgi:hypothetical protein